MGFLLKQKYSKQELNQLSEERVTWKRLNQLIFFQGKNMESKVNHLRKPIGNLVVQGLLTNKWDKMKKWKFHMSYLTMTSTFTKRLVRPKISLIPRKEQNQLTKQWALI